MIKRSSTSKASSTRAAKAVVAPSPEPIQPPTPPAGSGYKRAMPIAIALVLFVGGIGYFGHAAIRNKPASTTSKLQVRDGVDAKEVANIIDRVAELVVVQKEEIPTVATVQDISVLRPQNPTLYRDAENGDKLLVWSDKIVVYSASKDRLLVVLPINVQAEAVNQNTPSTDARVAAATVPEPSVTIEVRNGTPTPGVARTLNDKLKAEGFKTLAPGDARNKNYESTVIYNATGKTIPKTLEKLVASTGGTIVSALEGEGSTKADLLIIVGTK